MKSTRSSKKNGCMLVSAPGEESKVLSFSDFNEDARTALQMLPLAYPADIPEQNYTPADTRRLLVLSAFKNELLHVRTQEKLVQLAAHYLPLADIKTMAIFLQEHHQQTQFAGGFFADGDIVVTPCVFSAERAVPEQLEAHFKKGMYLVFALVSDGTAIGYLLLGSADADMAVYKDAYQAITHALLTIRLLNTVQEAKDRAEQAVREKNDFFANMGSDLCDPLKDLSAKITQMETNVEKGILDADILSEQLLFLKSQIASQLEKTETLVELTRTQVEDLPMDKTLFTVAQILPPHAVPSSEPLPLLFGDTERLQKAFQILLEKNDATLSVAAQTDGVHFVFESAHFDWQAPKLLLAEKIIRLQYGDIIKSDFSVTIILPYPNLAGLPPLKKETAPQKIYTLSLGTDKKSLLQLPVEPIAKDIIQSDASEESLLLYWNPDITSIDVWIKLYGFRHNERLFRTPLLCYSPSLAGHTFMQALEQKVSTQKKATVLFVNAKHTRYGSWATDENTVSIASIADFDKILGEVTPALIVFESVDEESIKRIRHNPRTVLVPILVIPHGVISDAELDILCEHPRIVLCNRGAAESEQFDARVQEILNGDEILPSHTGALVKKAILYLNRNVSQQIVRWKLADTVHVSEDYLTRIFHKELGLSLWEYLNRYRIFLAEKMLLETNDTIYEIAEKTGFQDQAYFCRVFKKIYGVPPGKIRTKQ